MSKLFSNSNWLSVLL